VGGSLSTGIEYTGEAVGDRAGESIAGAGDVDSDGYDDFLIGAPSSDAGVTYLALGGPAPAGGTLSAAIAYAGESVGDFSGLTVSGAGDLDADGFADFLVGGHQADTSGSDAGVAYIVLGGAVPASSSLASAIRLTGENSEDYAGQGVAGVGDANADGYSDMATGALGNDDAGSAAGAAYLILGKGL
jgi:hypothetical protein